MKYLLDSNILLQVELLSRKLFREILAPVRESFKASGMTADELDALVEAEREAIWQEKQTGNHNQP